MSKNKQIIARFFIASFTALGLVSCDHNHDRETNITNLSDYDIWAYNTSDTVILDSTCIGAGTTMIHIDESTSGKAADSPIVPTFPGDSVKIEGGKVLTKDWQNADNWSKSVVNEGDHDERLIVEFVITNDDLD